MQLVRDSDLGIEVHTVLAGKWRRYHKRKPLEQLFDFKTNLLNLRDLLLLAMGTLQSLWLMLRLWPKTVFLKGGFVCVPIGWAAGLTGRRLITHDSDSTPGLANRLVAPFVDIHAVAVEADYPYPKDRQAVVGVPIRAEYKTAAAHQAAFRRELKIPLQAKVLFVGGSSQGARRLDDAFEDAASDLLTRFEDLYIIQIFGRLNADSLQSRYQSLPPAQSKRLLRFGFVSDVYKHMTAADVLIGRAGATFIAEAAALSKALILVPAPQLVGGHQLKNAELLASQGAAKVLDEAILTPQLLADIVADLLTSRAEQVRLGDNLSKLVRNDAAERLASLIAAEK